METIVLGFDGSEASIVALDWVAERAASRPTHVEIVKIGGTLLQDDAGRDIGLVEAEHRVRDRAPDAEVDSHRLVGTDARRAARSGTRRRSARRRSAPRTRDLVDPSRWMPLRVASRSRTPVVVVPDDWDPTTGRVVVGSGRRRLVRAPRRSSLRGRPRHAQTPLALVHTWTMPRPQMEGSVALLASPIEARAVQRRILRDAAARAQAAHPGSRHRADPGAEQSRLGAAARRARRISARAGHAPSGAAGRARCSDRSARTCSRSAAPRSASSRETSRPDNPTLH